LDFRLRIADCGLRIDGIASAFAFGYDPTGRSINYNGPLDSEAHDGQNYSPGEPELKIAG